MKNLFGAIACLLMITGLLKPSYGQDSSFSLAGTVYDESNNPVAHASVSICAAGPKVGYGSYSETSYPDCKKKAQTDQDGKFAFKGLDKTKKFRLAVAAPGLQAHLSDWLKQGSQPKIVLKNENDVQEASSFVSGVVVDENGEPVVGAVVSPHGAKTSQRSWTGRVKEVSAVVTNAVGEFTMKIPDNFQYLSIEVQSPGYCGIEVYELKPGDVPTEVILPTGAEVTGRLVHDGVPVTGLMLAVVQANRSANRERGIFVTAIGCKTDQRGRFRFSNLPPSQKYCIYTVVGQQNTKRDQVMTSKTFSVPGSGETRDLGDLSTVAPISIQGKVQRLSGKPLPKNFELSFSRNPPWQSPRFKVAEDGSFHAKGLPAETYEIRLYDRAFEIVANKIKYQSLGPQSFGVYANKSIKDLVITIQRGTK